MAQSATVLVDGDSVPDLNMDQLGVPDTPQAAPVVAAVVQDHANAHEDDHHQVDVVRAANDVEGGRDTDIVPVAQLTDVKRAEDEDCVMVETSGSNPDPEGLGELVFVENPDKATNTDSNIPVKALRRRPARARV